MKRLFLCLLIGLCNISAFGQYKFTLEINSRTLLEKTINLEIYNNQTHIPIQLDSFTVKNGHATINGQVKQPSNFAAFTFTEKGKDIITQFVIDSGKNNISLELPGGESIFLKLRSDAKGYLIYDEINKIFLDEAAHYPKPTRVKGYLKIPQDLMDQITQDELKRLEKYQADFVSLICLYHMSKMDSRPDYAKKILATLAKLSNGLKSTAVGKQLYSEETGLINNKIASSPGNQVPIFNVRDINDLPFSNASLKGQNYMIVFSATWCGPCQQELPKLKKLYQTYKQKGLKIIYFNNDDDVTRWKKHVTINKLDWINVSERLKASESKIEKSFGVYSIPTCLIVNKDGVIVYNSDKTDPGINHIESYIKRVIFN